MFGVVSPPTYCFCEEEEQQQQQPDKNEEDGQLQHREQKVKEEKEKLLQREKKVKEEEEKLLQREKKVKEVEEKLQRRQLGMNIREEKMVKVSKGYRVQVLPVPCGSSAPKRLGIRISKVIMLGNSGVGKTSILYSLIHGPHPELLLRSFRANIGPSYTDFDILVFNNVRVQLQIWDTAGQERFRCMVPMYMRNAGAAILVYDITSRDSFDKIDEWHSEVMRCPTAIDEPAIVLIGNKADQNNLREVAEGEGVSKALRLNARFFELSAVDTEVIRTLFNLVAEQIVHKCSDVESAREVDETMFEADSETGEEVAGGESEEASPVIRLANDGGGTEEIPVSSCCSAL